MSETQTNKEARVRKIRHRGRGSQVLIYLGKQFRFFINQSDWKVLPMSAVIAALVGIVIRSRFFINMEGSLIGAFALTCTAIWNGCFNSIQAVCRERAIIKREHRSGMHISSYVCAHMVYQFLLCAAQTALTMYVLKLMKVQFPAEGFLTSWMIVDVGLCVLLITYASDMMSLFISSLCRTTTGAMTVMPFVLIFQLVFSGSIIPVPSWCKGLSDFTISNYGVKAIAAVSGYNELPMVTAWNTLDKMRENEIGGTVTLGQIMDLVDSSAVEKRRDMEVVRSFTIGEVVDILNAAERSLHLRDLVIARPVTIRDVLNTILNNDAYARIRNKKLFPALFGAEAITVGSLIRDLLGSDSAQDLLDNMVGKTITLGQALDFLHADELAAGYSEKTMNKPITLGDIADFIKNNEALNSQRGRTFTVKAKLSDLFDAFGEERLKTFVQEKTAAASQNPDYERTTENIVGNWIMLGIFAFVFVLLSTIVLELIDKDKR